MPEKQRKSLHFCRHSQADGQIRTGDLILTKDALYRLSYISTHHFRSTHELLYGGMGTLSIGIRNFTKEFCGGFLEKAAAGCYNAVVGPAWLRRLAE